MTPFTLKSDAFVTIVNQIVQIGTISAARRSSSRKKQMPFGRRLTGLKLPSVY